MSIEVLKPGALSTFQDLGRTGHQHLGVPVNGVMDERSHRLANALVGNSPDEATLEITLIGPSLKFSEPAVVAVCGADLELSINGQPAPGSKALALAADSVLSFAKRRSGLRAYLAVKGGFRLRPVMGSCSTFVRGHYGGITGSPLQKGDRIELKAQNDDEVRAVFVSEEPFSEKITGQNDSPIRIIPGREWKYFTSDAKSSLLGEAYRITPQSDRMGYRLDGPSLMLEESREMRSEAVSFGMLQVPPDGKPILLMADRQTTGGYPKIANVCSVDFPRLAQLMPGEQIRFVLTDVVEAQKLALSQARAFRSLRGC